MRFPAMTPAAARAAMLALRTIFSILAIGTMLWRINLNRQDAALQATVAALQAQLLSQPPVSDTARRGADFVLRLSISAPVDPIVRELQRSSADEGIAFLTVSSAPRSPTLQTLGRTELSVGLRGAYPPEFDSSRRQSAARLN